MEKIEMPVSHLRVTNQRNGTHSIVFVGKNDIATSVIYQTLYQSNNITLGYSWPDKQYLELHVQLNDKGKYFVVTVDTDDNTKHIPEYIDKKQIAELWAGFLNKDGNPELYGAQFEVSQ